MKDFLQLERRGPIAILKMDRQESMNAIGTHEDCQNIISTFERLNDNRGISCVILTGTGKAFSAGGNLKGMKDRTGIGVLDQPDSTRRNYRDGVQAVIRAMMDCEIPMIAAINGHAIGLGCDLACTADIRIAAESAKFACSFIKVGLIPGDGGTWLLQKVLGYPKAAELFLTGDTFSAQDAKEFGLVNDVVPDAELLDRAIAMAERITCNPPRALRLTKRLLREAQHSRLSDILELSSAYQAIIHETADNKEAINAFLAKRKPKFTGD